MCVEEKEGEAGGVGEVNDTDAQTTDIALQVESGIPPFIDVRGSEQSHTAEEEEDGVIIGHLEAQIELRDADDMPASTVEQSTVNEEEQAATTEDKAKREEKDSPTMSDTAASMTSLSQSSNDASLPFDHAADVKHQDARNPAEEATPVPTEKPPSKSWLDRLIRR